MNFYNPYFYSMPTETGISSLLSRFSLRSLISGTSKTLNFVNQAIPVVKQVSPIMKNLKTMFNVMNEFKKNDTSEVSNSEPETIINNSNDNGPTFFL